MEYHKIVCNWNWLSNFLIIPLPYANSIKINIVTLFNILSHFLIIRLFRSSRKACRSASHEWKQRYYTMDIQRKIPDKYTYIPSILCMYWTAHIGTVSTVTVHYLLETAKQDFQRNRVYKIKRVIAFRCDILPKMRLETQVSLRYQIIIQT
jgi:uncharacterized protein YhhL (DUF1145 family)